MNREQLRGDALSHVHWVLCTVLPPSPPGCLLTPHPRRAGLCRGDGLPRKALCFQAAVERGAGARPWARGAEKERRTGSCLSNEEQISIGKRSSVFGYL